MKAVIQCGGKGTRLRPHTSILPKPLMPIGARPVLELVLKWLRRNGIRDVFITTGYLGHLIRSVCGDGNQWNMRITYTQELEPLGTIGPLSLLREQLNEPFLVLNGDVLTDLNLNQFLSSHRRNHEALTIATANRPTKMDFGVIDATDGLVTGFREKPELSHLVNMGIYCMVEYRPIYVTGDVLTPGQQVYRASMTVHQAVAVAGGFSLLRSRAQAGAIDPADLVRDYQSFATEYIKEYFHVVRTNAELGGMTASIRPDPARYPCRRRRLTPFCNPRRNR